MKHSLLVVEDASDYQLILSESLRADYDVTIASTGKQAIDLIKNKKFDLMLIDITLPDISGLQICNYIKNQSSTKNIPVILVTSKNDTEDKVQGFDTGADDYITKPFHFKELQARIKARLRNSKNLVQNDIIEIPYLKIDLNKQSVCLIPDGQLLDLTRVEFKLLVCFAQRIDHVLSREYLLNEVWPENLNVSERTVDTHISNLRKKLSNVNVKISAVHGNGYRFTIIKKLTA